ncbi:MAG: ABC transporter substrate-binding protein [Actinomycetota bacterium]
MRSVAFVATIAILTTATPAVAADPLRYTIGVAAPIGSIDITDGTSAVAREIWRLQYPTLTALSSDGLTRVPGLADGWTTDDAGRSWTYTIRADATWSDGTPVTATDVAYSLERARDERWPYAGATLDGLSAIIVDERSVRITTAEPGTLPTLLLHVVPRHVFEAGTDVDASGIVGSGDWRVVERTETEVRLTVVERPGRPALDEIVFRAYADSDELIDALDDSEVDVAAALPADAYDAVRHVSGVTAIHANDGDQWVMRVRMEDANLRGAIVRAVDRDRLVRDAVAGVGRAATLPVVARSSEFLLDPRALANISYAPGIARRRLERATVIPDLITLRVPSDATAERIAADIESMLGDIGLSVERTTDPAAHLELVRRDPDDNPLRELSVYVCAGDTWCDATYDAAYDRYLGTTDTATQHAAVRDMVTRLVTETAEIVLLAPDELQAFRRDGVDGVLREPSDVRLVTLWPGIEHYREIVVAREPAGEELPTTTFVAIAAAVVVAFAAALAVAARLGRSRSPVDRDVQLAVDGERLPRDGPPP